MTERDYGLTGRARDRWVNGARPMGVRQLRRLLPLHLASSRALRKIPPRPIAPSVLIVTLTGHKDDKQKLNYRRKKNILVETLFDFPLNSFEIAKPKKLSKTRVTLCDMKRSGHSIIVQNC